MSTGASEDVLVLNWDQRDNDCLLPGLDPFDLLFSRAGAGHINQLIADGKSIVLDDCVVVALRQMLENRYLVHDQTAEPTRK